MICFVLIAWFLIYLSNVYANTILNCSLFAKKYFKKYETKTKITIHDLYFKHKVEQLVGADHMFISRLNLIKRSRFEVELIKRRIQIGKFLC